MSQTQSQAFISQFTDTIYTVTREGGSKLMGLFPTEMAKGEKHFFERHDKIPITKINSRLEVPEMSDPAHSRRMATIDRYLGRTYLDDIDKLKMLIDPTSEYVKALSDAHGENFDLAAYNALLGTAATGADGSGSEPFDSNNQIAHGSAGLSVAKFHQALRILESNEVDMDSEKIYLAVGARGVEDLLTDTTNSAQFTSFDYQNMKPLAGSTLPNFRGVNIIRTQRVPDETQGSVYRAIMFTEKALKVAMAENLDVKIDVRNDLAHVQQISTYMMFGMVRMDEKLVVDILYQ